MELLTSTAAQFILLYVGGMIWLSLVMTDTESRFWRIAALICVLPAFLRVFSVAILGS